MGAKKTPTQLSDRLRRRIGRLHRRKDREREGRVLVEGIRAAGEAVAAETTIRVALTSPRLNSLQGGATLAQALSRLDAEIIALGDEDLAELSGLESSQGVLLIVDEPPAPELASLDKGQGTHVVLDGIQDPGNVGALVRSAVAFGFVPVVLPGSADPWSPKAVRAAAGTVFRAPPLRTTHADWLAWAAAHDVEPWVGDAGGEPLPDAAHDIALVIGNEGGGVSQALRAAPHRTVSIPHARGAESLNAAVAGSVMMFAVRSRTDDPTGSPSS